METRRDEVIKVLFFGPVAERIGTSALSSDYRPNLLIQNLRDELALKYPQAFELVSFTAINGEQIRDMNTVLPDNSEVAFMAKFSGG
jgi:molybdopterin synthase sulfur carrier subunit